jgi:tRNA threonylcarbamoyladenosine biosynthesis protein TsaE
MTQVWTTSSSDETLSLGVKLGSLLKGGEIILLESDLGGGKTTFTKGVARGLGITDEVVSPTFTIEQVYHGNYTLHHYDFYRLYTLGVLTDELIETLSDRTTVKIIEWPNAVATKIFDQFAVLSVKIDPSKLGENSRKITINYPATHENIIQALAEEM